jgi:hypothetical protein
MNEKKQLTQKQRGNTNIRIYSVPKSLNDDLRNISRNLNISMSSFLKEKLTEIRNTFKTELRK